MMKSLRKLYSESSTVKRPEVADAGGGTYTGERLNGLKHGKGEEVCPDKSKYTGEFENGFASGQGQMVYADGSKYVGEWKKGHYHGKGKSCSVISVLGSHIRNNPGAFDFRLI
eukprot:CAMPEP_0172165510 /NCGR_PEP_ID=MMETSP1050-20130122/8453_1 /TAXON_ID=233186 /ORGANISM="Cryptomonas curvata, Strain CCAP979/52" /LENGTH=112 /DNA_ID=CAMNT_0012835991 /DNA_START=89 /DNA_END=427 /DNA_ORIENTATION=-